MKQLDQAMNSLGTEFVPEGTAQPEAAARAGAYLDDISVSVVEDPKTIAAEWKTLQLSASNPFCDYVWAKSWRDAFQEDPKKRAVIAIGRTALGEPLFIIPLMLERKGLFRVLAWPGGAHAAYHSGLFSPRCREMVTSANAKKFWACVFAALPKADVFTGYGLPSFEIEAASPLRHLKHFRSGCNSYRLSITDGWENVYQRTMKSKVRSNDRRCERRLADMGELRFRIAVSSEERSALLQALIQQKSERLSEHGMPDFFADNAIRCFYESLAASREWGPERSVLMSAIELNGKIIAANFGLIDGRNFHGLVLSMEEGEVGRYGPGRLLVRRTLEHLSNNGIECIDFGVGDAPYKDGWCDETVERFDVLHALTASGYAYCLGTRLFLSLKTRIKRSPALLRLATGLRRYAGC